MALSDELRDEADKLVQAARAVGFEDFAGGKLLCTADQLLTLVAMAVTEALRQAGYTGEEH